MPVYLDCVVCGKEFEVPPSRAKTAKACSNECATQVRAKSRQRRMVKTCEQCGEEFEIPLSHEDRRRFCSNECRYASEAYRYLRTTLVRGAANPQWVGGVVNKSDGYKYRLVGVEHPFSTKSGYVLEHRVVMEQWLRANDPGSKFLIQLGDKFYLSPKYLVHHKDEDRANNRIENLMCVTPAEHQRLHAEMRKA